MRITSSGRAGGEGRAGGSETTGVVEPGRTVSGGCGRVAGGVSTPGKLQLARRRAIASAPRKRGLCMAISLLVVECNWALMI
jgi:hypothetical protein